MCGDDEENIIGTLAGRKGEKSYSPGVLAAGVVERSAIRHGRARGHPADFASLYPPYGAKRATGRHSSRVSGNFLNTSAEPFSPWRPFGMVWGSILGFPMHFPALWPLVLLFVAIFVIARLRATSLRRQAANESVELPGDKPKGGLWVFIERVALVLSLVTGAVQLIGLVRG